MLLIGVKKERGSFSGYDSEGYGGTTINSTNFDIIKESHDKNILSDFLSNVKEKALKSREKLDILENITASSISEEEFEKLENKYLNDIKILNYDYFLIIEGEILN